MFYFWGFIGLVFPALISVAFLTLLERKILSLVGLRFGPNKISMMGLLQPIADAVKLSNKQTNSLSNFSFFFHYFTCFGMFLMSVLIFFCLFTQPEFFSLKYALLFFMILLGFNCFFSILCGWSMFSKYSLIGSLRTVSQLISYEALLFLCFFYYFLNYSSLNFSGMTFAPLNWFWIFAPLCFVIWTPAFMAELNRAPYDFSEGESELVSGFNTEFGSSCFTLIFLAEYMNIVFFCLLTSSLFFYWAYYFFFFFFFLLDHLNSICFASFSFWPLNEFRLEITYSLLDRDVRCQSLFFYLVLFKLQMYSSFVFKTKILKL